MAGVGAVAGVALLIGAAAAGAVTPAAAYQSLTPPWPLQAPLLDAALVAVPSLHVPVAAAGVPDGATGVAAAAGEALLMGAAAVPPAATYQSLTPPCPLHAPLLDDALVAVPSLHVPVAAAAGLTALASAGAGAALFFLLLPDDAPLSELVDSGAAGAAGLEWLLLLPEEAPGAALLTAGAAVLASAAVPYHFLTPSCPLHAPLFEAAEV